MENNEETQEESGTTSTPEGNSGAAESSSESSSTAENSTSSPEGKKGGSGKTFTQEELNEIAGKIRDEARESGTNKVLEELGVDSIDEAKTVLQEYQELQKEKMSEKERLETELAELREKNEELAKSRTELESATAESNLKAAVISEAAGRFQDPDVVYKVLDRSNVSINEDGSVEGLDDALNTLADEHPWMLRQEKEKMSTTSATNAESAEKKGRTDEDRRAEYFGMSGNPDFWEGGSMRQLTEE